MEKYIEEQYRALLVLGDYNIMQNIDDASEILIKYHENVHLNDKERYLTQKELERLYDYVEDYEVAAGADEIAEAQFSIENLLKM